MSRIMLAEAPRVGYVPDGLTVGRPLRVMTVGSMFSRLSGDKLADVSASDLDELVSLFDARSAPRPDQSEPDPVVVDWQHASASDVPLAPDVSGALGRVVALMVDGPALYAVPAYTPRGLQVVEDAAGVLWPSPEWATGPISARESGESVGRIQMLALTLTPRPQQTGDKIDRVLLSETRTRGMEVHMAHKKASEAQATQHAAAEAPDPTAIAADVELLKAGMEEMKAMIMELKGSMEAAEDMPAEDMPEDDVEVSAASEKAGRLAVKMGERLAKVEAQLRTERRDRVLTEMIADARLAPAERDMAAEVYMTSEALFGKLYGTRKAGDAGPDQGGESGHGRGAERKLEGPANRTELDTAVRKLMSEKAVSYRDADALVRAANPDAYARAVITEG